MVEGTGYFLEDYRPVVQMHEDKWKKYETMEISASYCKCIEMNS
jgi:hypothetical protein